MNVLLVFLGGGLGSVLRFGIAAFFSKTSLSLPVATLSSNVISCFIFGSLLYTFHERHLIPDTYKHLIIIGVCGGLSTFSTFSYETFDLIKQGMAGWAAINILLSCALCTGIFFLFSR